MKSPIDAYLRKLPEPQRSTLAQVRKLMTELLPDATECISYGIPAFRRSGEVVGGFAAGKKHCSYYPFSGGILRTLREKLGTFPQTKSALHFPHDRPLTKTLLKSLVRARLKEISAAASREPSSTD